MKTKDKSGYILVLTLMMLSILIIVVTSMFFNETAHTALSNTVINREKAKMLALSGVQLAMSKLSIVKAQENKNPKLQKQSKESKEKKEASSKEVLLLKKIWPIINRWQAVQLKADIDGIDGQIRFSISSEDGKININELYNYATHKYQGEGDIKFDAKKFLQEFFKLLVNFTGERNAFNGLIQYLSKRSFALNETTQLLEIPEFSYFQNKVFYEPPKNSEINRPIYLTDIFTIWTDSSKLQPWMLSDSICAILGLKRAEFGDINKRQKMLEPVLKNFKTNFDWKVDWDKTLMPFYGKGFGTLIKGIENLFNDKFDTKIFSVVCYGTVADVTQRVFAIVELDSNYSNAKLKKLYWI